MHRIYGQRATLSLNYKAGDWDSVQAWILKAGSGWHQAETAEDLQNMTNFVAGSLGAATAHRIKWILSARVSCRSAGANATVAASVAS